jgi:hypothetical protein
MDISESSSMFGITSSSLARSAADYGILQLEVQADVCSKCELR